MLGKKGGNPEMQAGNAHSSLESRLGRYRDQSDLARASWTLNSWPDVSTPNIQCTIVCMTAPIISLPRLQRACSRSHKAWTARLQRAAAPAHAAQGFRAPSASQRPPPLTDRCMTFSSRRCTASGTRPHCARPDCRRRGQRNSAKPFGQHAANGPIGAFALEPDALLP